MSIIKVNTIGVSGLNSKLRSVNTKNNDCVVDLTRVRNNLDWEIKAKGSIDTRLTNAQKKLKEQSSRLTSYSNVLNSVVELYGSTDNKLAKDAKSIVYQLNQIIASSSILSSLINNVSAFIDEKLKKALAIGALFGLVATPTAVSLTLVSNLLRGFSSSSGTDKTIGGALIGALASDVMTGVLNDKTDDSSGDETSSTTGSNQTISKEELLEKVTSSYNGPPQSYLEFESPWCTWYTYNRLYEKTGYELQFTRPNSRNGNQWIEALEGNNQQIKYWGENALYEIIYQNQEKPIENIIVSFSGPSSAGHVMLIDAIIDGKIYFSEHVNDFYTNESGYQDSGHMLVATIDDFMYRYRNNGSIVGAVQIIT